MSKKEEPIIAPATHSWRGSTGGLKRCCICKTQTTGEVKHIADGKRYPLCSGCAGRAGF